MNYQRAYLQWYFGRNHKKIIMAAAFLLVSMIIPIWNCAAKDQMEMVIAVAYCLLALNTLGALILPILQFRYQMNQRACDLYLPLPISRKHMFFMQFGIGALLLALPNLIYEIAVLGSTAGRSYWKGYTFLMLMLLLFSFVLYCFNTFLVLRCHNLADAIFAVVGFLVAQLLLVAAIDSLLNNAVSKILPGGGSAYEFFSMDLYMFLSPVICAIRATEAIHVMVSDEIMHGFATWTQYCDIHPLHIALYAVLAIVIIYFAMRTYEKSKGEDSEQKTTSKWIYPSLITIVSGCLIFENILSLNYFIFTVILYFIMNFVAQRKIAVRPEMVIRFIVLVAVAQVFSQSLIQTDGFGMVKDLYDRSELQSVYLDISFIERDDEEETNAPIPPTTEPTYLMMNDWSTDEWLLDHVYALQKDLSKDSDYKETSMASIDIHYKLSNQKMIHRYYVVDAAFLDQLNAICDYISSHDYIDHDGNED